MTPGVLAGRLPDDVRPDGGSTLQVVDARVAVGLRVTLGVPAYVHPSVDPQLWVRLARAAAQLRFVVVNVDSGPGKLLDPAYPPVIALLRSARVRMAGYVDTDYGRRSVQEVVDEARLWVTRYGVRGVFLDQVAGDLAHLEYYAACALGARAAGAQFVVANPGMDCHPAYAELANVTVTFEGTFAEYSRYRPSAAMLAQPAERFCHLVYDVPHARLAEGPHRAAARHAGSVLFTDGSGTNPWDRVPQALLDAVTWAPPQPPGRAGTHTAHLPGWGRRRYARTDPGPP